MRARFVAAALLACLLAVPLALADDSAQTVTDRFAAHYINVIHVSEAIRDQRWVRIAPLTREALECGLERLATVHRVQTSAIRAL